MIRSIRCLALLLVALAEAASAASLKVTLALTPAETLPGVPVSVSLTIANLTTRDIAISSYVAFAVKSADGATGHLAMYFPKQYWSGEVGFSSKYMVPAEDKITLFIPVTEDLDSPLFDRSQLNEPGQYDLVATINGTSGATGESNPVHLRVITPTGDDEAVWKALEGELYAGVMRVECTSLIQKHRASRYYQLVAPFCVPFRSPDQYSHDVAELDQYARDVLQGFPLLAGAYLDAARFAVIGKYLGEARAAYGQNKFALAGSISAAGRPIAQDLIDHSASTFGAVAGAWAKRQLVDEAGWRSHFERMSGPSIDLKVLPAVTCVVDNGDGTFSADFGFDNPNNYDIEVPIGPDNQMGPGPDNQGQPIEFAPGTKESAFTVKGLTGVTKWTLQGKTVKASIALSPKCSDVQPPEPQP